MTNNDLAWWCSNHKYLPFANPHSRVKYWYKVKHLRCFGCLNRLVAAPHDSQSRATLHIFHRALNQQQFISPLQAETNIFPGDADHRSIYVTAIPRPMVDWFRLHTLDQIEDQISLYCALQIVEANGVDEHVLRDTESGYHDRIFFHLREFASRYPNLQLEVLRSYNPFEVKDSNSWIENEREQNKVRLLSERSLPPWFLREKSLDLGKETMTYIDSPSIGDEQFPWKRHSSASFDAFGVVCWGLFERDELMLAGKKLERNSKGKLVEFRLSREELTSAQEDTLDRVEASASAFDFFMFQRGLNGASAEWLLSGSKDPGHVYFISDGTNVKIGHTIHDPQQRLKALQTGNAASLRLLGYISGSRSREQQLHKRFEECRVQGEWFDLKPDDFKRLMSLQGTWFTDG